MKKKLSCKCVQGYHMSSAARMQCLSKMKGIIQRASKNHQQDCNCDSCENKRINRLIQAHKQSRRVKLCLISSNDDSSEDNLCKSPIKNVEYGTQILNKAGQQMQIQVQRAEMLQNTTDLVYKGDIYLFLEKEKIRQQRDEQAKINGIYSNISWNWPKIMNLMKLGMGNPDKDWITTLKYGKTYNYKNRKSYLRIALFLHPLTTVMLSDWHKFIIPQQLVLNAKKPIDLSSYRERVQYKLDRLSKKLKNIVLRNQSYYKTKQMIILEEKTEYYTAIIEKYFSIQEHQELIHKKKQQQWFDNIVILDQGQHSPAAINKFADLKYIDDKPPQKKFKPLRLIQKKDDLYRRYRKTLEQAHYFGIIKRPSLKMQSFLDVNDYLEVTPRKIERILDQNQSKLDYQIKSPTKTHWTSKCISKYGRMIDQSEEPFIIQSKFNNYSNHAPAVQCRTYLHPRIINKNTQLPLSVEQIWLQVSMLMKQSYFDKDSQHTKISNQDEQVLCPQVDLYQCQTFQKPLFQELKLKSISISLHKPSSREFLPQSNLNMYSQEEILQKNIIPQSKGKLKGFDCMDFQKCSKKSCQFWLSGSILDCTVCNAAYHKVCWPINDLCDTCQLINTSSRLYFSVPTFALEKYLYFSELSKVLVPPLQSVWPQGEQAAINQIERNLENKMYCVNNYFQNNFIIYPFYNPGLKRLHQADQRVIESYEKKKLAFPVIVAVIDQIKGKGLVARRIIQKGELVATYSGNVMSLAQVAKQGDISVKPYLFQLVLGPDAMSTFVVYPKDYASVGFFMNHANSKCKKSKINVKTSIAIAETGPIILMQSTRKITYGEELLYDYNGAFESYNTSAFE